MRRQRLRLGTFGFEWNSTTIASTCAYIPTVRKPAPWVTEFTTDNMLEATHVIMAELMLALQVGNIDFYG